MAHISFPVDPKIRWLDCNHIKVADPYLKNWLLDTSSLTERLQSQCRKFAVEVLGQAEVPLNDSERQVLKANERDGWEVREVILTGDDQPWVFARSALPGIMCQSELANLGNKPLGKILFNDARFVRSSFQLCHIESSAPLLSALNIAPAHALWGRRSVFSFQGLNMLVAEVFLPSAPAYGHAAPMGS